MKLSFFIKINAYLILLILFFNKKSHDLNLFIKLEGDELEETILKFFKFSLTHRYISNRVLLCLHYSFIKILVSEEMEESEISTCRKIEKKDRFLSKKNLDNFFKPKNPKLFYEYEKSNKFIEKFYRRNLLKKEKGEIDRVVIVNILKILLSTIDNNNSTSNQIEYTKDYIPEIILKYYYVDQGNKMTFSVENTNENSLLNSTNNNAILTNNNTNNNMNNTHNYLNLLNHNIGTNNNISLNNSKSNILNDSSANMTNMLLGSKVEGEGESSLYNNNYDKNNYQVVECETQNNLITNNNNNNNNQMNLSNNNISLAAEENSQLMKMEEKENLEFSAKTYLEILQNSPAEAELYSIIDTINKVSLTSLIIYFYYFILKTLQNYDLIQFSYFAFHLFDSNGLLVFLKILSQDFKAIEQQFISIYETDIINIQFGELIEFILLFDLKLIYKICFRNEEYICKPLIECKLQAMLKKVMNSFPQNEKIKIYCMKLFKIQLKYFDKNWRLENLNIISSIYTTLKIKSEAANNTNENPNVGSSAIENYLKYEKKEKILAGNFNKEGFCVDLFTNEELKRIHLEYHNYNYYKYINSVEEIEKYQNNLYQSNYARIYLQLLEKATLSQEFIDSYK